MIVILVHTKKKKKKKNRCDLSPSSSVKEQIMRDFFFTPINRRNCECFDGDYSDDKARISIFFSRERIHHKLMREETRKMSNASSA